MWTRLCLLFALSCTLSAQQLARPGLAGSGLDKNPWWLRAIFYQVDSAAGPIDFKAISVRLDALRSLGVDALILPAPALPTDGAPMPNLDDFDQLTRQASGHNIRVLLSLSATPDVPNIARFWLNHGVAGFRVTTPPGASATDSEAIVQSLRKLTSGALGQRIILSDADLAQAENTKPSRHTTRTPAASNAQLQIDTRLNQPTTLDAATLRQVLTEANEQPNLLLDIRPNDRAQLANVIATAAMLLHPSAIIDSGANLTLEPTPERPALAEPEPAVKPTPPPQPPPGTYLPYVPYVPPATPKRLVATKPVPPSPLTAWYRQLIALHHDNAVVHSGAKIFLDFDAQNALVWVNRPSTSSPLIPPVVVICNLSASPVQLSLTTAMDHLNLHGWFLRPLLRSWEAMGAQPLDNIKIPPYGVYIGELRR